MQKHHNLILINNMIKTCNCKNLSIQENKMQLLTGLGLFLVTVALIEDNNALIWQQKDSSSGWKIVRPKATYSDCTVTHTTYDEGYDFRRSLTKVSNILAKIIKLINYKIIINININNVCTMWV